MDQIRSFDLKYEYSIAGLRVLTNRPAELGKAYTGTDGKVLVVFTRKEVDLAKYADLLGISGDREDWYPYADYDRILAAGSKDGQNILICDRDNLILDCGAFLRQVIPFASALQNKLVLHASAVQTKQGIVAFIGASGVGKSTLAKRLNDLGFLPVADDLLPCRFSHQQVMVPLAPGSSTMPRQLPLTRIYFLSRDASLKRMNLSALGKMKFIQLLLQNGFSELPLANVWKMQFVQYSRIVDLAAAFQLTLPDGTDHLEETLMTLVGQPFPVGEAMHFPLSSAQAERYMS